MALAEGVSVRHTYKAYATGVITSNSQPVSATDPAATGGQILRRVSSSLQLTKDTYQSQEIRSDRQIADFRHGVKRVTGSITGELSPLTYFDLIEAACRGTRVNALSDSNTEFTSVAADNATSKFTYAGGDPIAEGYRVGMIIRFASLSEATNNSKNFVILSFGGTSNREVTVYPAPTTMGADTTFTVTSTGKTIGVPSSSFVSRKFAFERYYSDLDIHELFTECRIAGFSLNLPATGLATIEIPVLGRDRESGTGGSSPFFTAPTAETTTGLTAAVNGLIRVAGATVGVVTGANINMNLNPSADVVVGQNFVPEIFLGRANVTGQLTAFFESFTIPDLFVNETEAQVLLYLTTTSAANSPALTILLPRVKFGAGGSPNVQGEGGQSITLPFQALRKLTADTTDGVEDTTIHIADTEIV